MTTAAWSPTIPFDAIVFDCDGTLSGIEGIDELARQNGVGHEVESLTADAMGRSGMTIQLYQRRLATVNPTLEQVATLADRYYLERAPDLDITLDILQRLTKPIYVISAGLKPAVVRFASKLGIPDANVFAIDIDFDPEGHYVDFDHASPLVNSAGKQGLILTLKQQHPRIAYIGDGLNDLAVHDFVDRFIGYGGFYYRKNIEAQCEFYLRSTSMLLLLPLLLTRAEKNQLTDEQQTCYEHGLALLLDTAIRSSNTKQSP